MQAHQNHCNLYIIKLAFWIKFTPVGHDSSSWNERLVPKRNHDDNQQL